MSDDASNPFRNLNKKQFPKSRKGKKPAQAPQRPKTPAASRPATPAPARQQRPPSEMPEENPEDIFLQAMQGVKPLEGVKGRDVPPPAPSAPEQRDAAPASEEAEVAGHLADLVSGKVEFALQYSEEYIHGHVLGLDSKLLVRLKAGYYSPEAHLDLHGMNAEQAFFALVQFIKEGYMQGRRCLLLIPGRGRNSPEGYGVLREAVQTWLTRDPLKRVVLAFCTALPKHGGAGALYVLLRREKGKGKINWERLALDEPPYLP